MPHRIFKRKSSGINRTLTNHSEPSTEESKGEFFTPHSPTGIHSSSLNCPTRVPNRVFVGGLTADTDEWDIRMKFVKFGLVKFVKIIRDNVGISKGYGFVTFDTEEEAKSAIEKAQIYIKGRKLNVAPAVKKKVNQSDSTSTEISSAESINGETARNQSKCNYKKQVVCHNSTLRPYLHENTGYLDTFAVLSTSENINNQYNCMIPYPYLVYVPQYQYQLSGAGFPYSTGGNFPDIIPVVPVPAQSCCLNIE